MNKNTIIIGRSAAIAKEIIDKSNIFVFPFDIDWPEMESLEGKNIFEKMRDAEKKGIKTTPKTSLFSPGKFKKIFEENLKKDGDIICILISSGLSGTYNSAIQAKKMLKEEDQKRIFIFDSLSVDAMESLFAIRASELSSQGKTGEEIIKILTDLHDKNFLFGMFDSPRWLEAGGRISHPLSVIMSQMQKIGMRPILSVKDGLVKPANLKMKAKDTANSLFKQTESIIKKGIEEGKNYKIGISHADSIEEAEKLKKLFEENYPQVKVEFVSITSAAIGSHVGPGGLICCLIEN
jgi:DegV family protein with EDD domain